MFTGSMPGLNGDEAFPFLVRDWLDGNGTWMWITPSNRIFTPLHPLVLAFVSKVFTPSVTAVRIPPLIYGCLLIGFACGLLRKVLPRHIFVFFILGIVAMPMHLVFSRISWEPALVPLFSLFVIYSIIVRRYLQATLFLFLALTVHYVCIFLAPLLFICWISDFVLFSKFRDKIEFLKLIGSFLCTLLVSHYLSQFSGIGGASDRLQLFFRAVDFEAIFHFFGNVFLGLVGTIPVSEVTAIPFEIWLESFVPIFGIVFISTVFWAVIRYMNYRRWTEVSFLLGMIISLYCMFFLTGEYCLRPGYQRFFLWASVPLCYALALIIRLLGRKGKLILYSFCASWLIFFACSFFGTFLYGSGGKGIYASNIVDPKQQAFEWIHERISKNKIEIKVAAEEWWLYWPAKYFLYSDPVRYFHSDPVMTSPLSVENKIISTADLIKIIEEGGYAVGFAGGIYDIATRGFLDSSGIGKKVFVKSDNEPYVLVWYRIR